MSRSRGGRTGHARQSDIRKVYQAETERTRDIHSKVRGVHTVRENPNAPTGAVLARAAIRHGIAHIDETPEDHVIPRKSITVKQLLAITARPTVETIHARQLDQKDLADQKFLTSDDAIAHVRMIETTDQRVTRQAERSLLITGKPGATVGTFKREGLIRKGLNTQRIITTIRELPPPDDLIGTAVLLTE